MSDETLDTRPPQLPEPLETARLCMRPFAAGDLAALAVLYADPRVMRWIGAGGVRDRDKTAASLDEMIALQARLGFSPWATIECETGRPIGESGLYPLEGTGPEVELSYLFAADVWGRGYATETGRAWLGMAFEVVGLERVVAVAYPENLASQRVMRKLGMVPDGTGVYYGAELVRYVIDRATRSA